MRNVATYALGTLLVLIVACAPAAAPSAPTAPAPTVAASLPTAPAVAPRPSSPQDAEWAKVVEAARREGVVVAYTFGLAGDVGNVVARAFKDKYGVKLEVVGGTSPVMLERVKAEYRVRQYIADLANFSFPRLVVLQKDGATASNKDLPVLGDTQSWLSGFHPLERDPQGHLLAYTTTNTGPWINTTLVRSGEEPKSWQELLDPKWKGKIIAGDPGVYIGTEQLYYALVVKSKRLSHEYFRSLGMQVKKFVPGGARAQVDALARGEGHISLTGSKSGGAAVVAEGAPLRALALSEGGMASLSNGWAELSKAPHPNAAKLFLNWFLSAEGQMLWANTASETSNRKDVPSFIHPAIKYDLSKLVLIDPQDDIEVEKRYSEGFMTKLWKGEGGK